MDDEILFLNSLAPLLEQREQTIIKGILGLIEGLQDQKVKEALQILNPDFFRSEILKLEDSRKNNIISLVILVAVLILIFKFIFSW